ncbi:MAG: hypothetical protein GY778_10090 [bacterium]|nr:hypothetical protein [bacterium]
MDEERPLVPILATPEFKHAYFDGAEWHIPGFSVLKVPDGDIRPTAPWGFIEKVADNGTVYGGIARGYAVGVRLHFEYDDPDLEPRSLHVARQGEGPRGRGPDWRWRLFIKCFRGQTVLSGQVPANERQNPQCPYWVRALGTQQGNFESWGQVYVIDDDGANPGDFVYLRFHSKVTSAFIGFGPPDSEFRPLDDPEEWDLLPQADRGLRGMQIYQANIGAPLVRRTAWKADEGFVKETVYGMYARHKPCRGAFPVGQIVRNEQAASGAERGWICVNRKDTELSAKADAGETHIHLVDTEGIRPYDVIGIALDDGKVHWTTVTEAAYVILDPVILSEGIPEERFAPRGSSVFTNRWEEMGEIP